MNRNNILFIILLFGFIHVSAQQKLSSQATLSVITCGPGNELYSSFGHSAFRVHDAINGLDRIYNYGSFDFNAPNFYLNFAKGKLTYQLSTSTFSRFLRVYQYENRWVKTQELNLDTSEVQALFDFLENNAKPENKSYQYDFFYDNCSTKIEQIIKTVFKDKVAFNNDHIITNKSHRELIRDYAKDFEWGMFGIDLALGSVIDDEASKDDYKFLPDYIYQAFDNATIHTNKPLVKNSRTFLKEKNLNLKKSIIRPLNIFLLIALFLLFITYKNYSTNKRSKWVDFSLYFTTGLIGIAVLLLWFATSHTATYKNLNFLWAFAPNVIVSFYMLKSKLPKWIRSYNWALLLLLVAMTLVWILKIQVFNNALIPLILALAVRYYYLISVRSKRL